LLRNQLDSFFGDKDKQEEWKEEAMDKAIKQEIKLLLQD
jgi:hypothetical protein